MLERLTQRLASSSIPNPPRVVFAGGDDLHTIRAETCTTDGVFMLERLAQRLASSSVPTRHVLSSLAVTTRAASGLKLALLTSPLCRSDPTRGAPVTASQSWA